METYTILESKREELQKAAAKWQKKASAYGKHLSVMFGAPYAVKRGVVSTMYDYSRGCMVSTKEDSVMAEVFDLSIESDLIKADDYQVAAKVEHLDGGNIVSVLDGASVPEVWNHAAPFCEHCNRNRSRRVTFLVKGQDGVLKQVGKSCLKDYTGIDPEWIASLQQMHDLILSDQIDRAEISEHPACLAYDTQTVVAAALRVADEFGYVKSSERNSNKQRIDSLMAKRFVATNEEEAEAKRICETVKTMDIDSVDGLRISKSYLLNAQTLAKSGYCKTSHFGIIAYLPFAMKKYEEEQERIKKRQEEHERAKVSQFVGEVGQRIEIEVESMRLMTSWENDYGMTFLYQFQDIQGNIFIWYASRAIDDCKHIKGMIKDHKMHDGICQTIMTRCKPMD